MRKSTFSETATCFTASSSKIFIFTNWSAYGIATAFGLGVAIVAVVCYNSFQSTVRRFEDDFQLIKLLFLSFADSEEEAGVQSKSTLAL